MAEGDWSDAERAGAELVPPAARVLLGAAEGGTEAARALPARGAVLFCDLSGFSQMGARAIARSERGAEELRAEIDAVFARVVEAVEAHGGRLLYYAGDAVAAWWPEDGDLAAAAGMAREAGLAVQGAVRAMPGDVGLTMRAAASAGDMWLLDLPGDGAARSLAFVGPALDALGGIELPPEGVALTGEAGAASIGGAPVPAAPLPAFDAAPWLGAHERSGLSVGARWLAEFRQAHVLHARLPVGAVPTRQAALYAGRTISEALEAVRAEGGTPLKLCRDDKGLVLMAAWGLASSAWEDGAERAVLAGRRIAGAGARAAIAGGKVFSGLVGAGDFRQFDIVGDPVNRAAAMSGSGGGGLVIDDEARAAAARRFETREAGRMALKGREGETRLHEVTAERLRGLAHAGALVGRAAEKERLAGIADAVARGERRDVAIVGEAGLGKSRLASWLVSREEGLGRAPLTVQADGLRRSTGHAALAPLVRRLTGLSEGSGEAACRAALARALGTDEEEDWPLLNPVLPAALPETSATAALTGAGRAERTRGLLARLVSRLVPERALVVVEDAHWLDSASWQLLDLLPREAGASLCLVMRPVGPDELPGEARRFLDEERIETIRLAPLSEEEGGALAAQALGADHAAPPLAALLHREAAGHPLYLASLALALAARGVVRVESGYANLRLAEEGLDRLDLPSGAAGAVQERIAALTPAEQLTVKAASVLGRSFTEEDLDALHPAAGAHGARADLGRAAEAGLVEPRGEGAWRFHHAIVADAARASLTTEQSRALHGAAADTVARRAGEGPDQADLALMAHHCERAGREGEALAHLEAAAEGARRAYANLEVVDLLTRAMRLAPQDADPAVIARWRYDVAHALRALGQYQRAEDLLKECLTGLGRAPPETGGQAARGLVGGYAAFRLRPHRAPMPEPERAPVILAADATMMLSEIHYELNKIPFALAEILGGANLARRAGGDSATLAKLYIGLSLISTSLPWALDGDALQAKALAMADRLDDPATRAWVYMVSGNYECGKAGWATGAGHFRLSMEVAEGCGERKTWETSASTLANLKRLEGWFEEARGWSDVTMAHSRDRGIVQGIIWSHNGRARDMLCLSDWEGLASDVEALERLLDDPANKLDANDNNQLVFHYARSALALHRGDAAGSLAALDAALEIVARTKRPQVYMTQNAAIYSEILRALSARGAGGDLSARQALVARSARRIGRTYRAGRPMAALTAGDAAHMAGSAAKAAQGWRASAGAARELAMPYAEAQALDRLAEAGAEGAGAERDALLSRLGIGLPDLWRLGA